MKREILFRGLRTDGKGWVYGYYMKASNGKEVHNIIFVVGNSVESNPIEVIPESVGQFTGLTDKNGKRIFEGDNVKNSFGIYVVEFNDGCFFACNMDYEDNVPLYVHNEESEKIGNIHEK